MEPNFYYDNEYEIKIPCIRIIHIPDNNYSCGFRVQYEVCYFNGRTPYLCTELFDSDEFREALNSYKERARLAEERG